MANVRIILTSIEVNRILTSIEVNQQATSTTSRLISTINAFIIKYPT